MPFAILRAEKLKSPGNIAGSLAHTFRTRDTPNADASRTPGNEVLVGGASPDEVKKAITERLPEKRRSDAVLAVEYFIGASPEAFDNRQGGDYFRDALKWLQDRHGAENVVSAVIHRDETSPHMTAMVIPLDEAGKLNAKKFLGGKAVLTAMQTEFAKKVGQQYGLERGLEGSRATHKTVREFYGELQQVERENGSQAVLEASKRVGEAVRTIDPKELKPQVLEKGLFSKTVETDGQVVERLAGKVAPAVAPVVKQQAQEIARLRAEKRQWDAERRRMTKEHSTIKELFGELFEQSKRLKPERFKQITGRVLDAIRAEVKQIRASRVAERPDKDRGGIER